MPFRVSISVIVVQSCAHVSPAPRQGPSDYDVASPGLPKGGKWTATTIKSSLELEMERKAQIPGPGQYDAPVALRTDKVRCRARYASSCRNPP
jgi:hypothetical protein